MGYDDLSVAYETPLKGLCLSQFFGILGIDTMSRNLPGDKKIIDSL